MDEKIHSSKRSRKKQISLAAEKGIKDYPCPAGGCLLTERNFAGKMRDYFTFTKQPTVRDIPLLKIGRHFRLPSGDKIMVARNEYECKSLKNLCLKSDHLLVPIDFRGPTVIIQGSSFHAAIGKISHYTKGSVQKTARLAHHYKGKNKIIYLKNYKRG